MKVHRFASGGLQVGSRSCGGRVAGEPMGLWAGPWGGLLGCGRGHGGAPGLWAGLWAEL